MATKEEINSKLVEEVAKYPLLYDASHSDYKRRDLRREAWKEVSREVSKVSPMDEKECKERWTHLRNSFIKELTSGSNATPSKNKTPYYLGEKMQFLIQYLKNAPQQEREPDVDDSYNEDSNVGRGLQSPGPHDALEQPAQPQPCPASTPPAKPQGLGRSGEQDALCNLLKALVIPNDEPAPAVKAEPSTSKQTNNTRSDATEKFLLSLLPDLELMNDNQLRQFRRKCLDAIEEILAQTH